MQPMHGPHNISSAAGRVAAGRDAVYRRSRCRATLTRICKRATKGREPIVCLKKIYLVVAQP